MTSFNCIVICNIDYVTDICVKMNDLDIELFLSVRNLSGWNSPPPLMNQVSNEVLIHLLILTFVKSM